MDDWTHGPAKWAAVCVLGGAAIFGMAWSITGRHPITAPQQRIGPVDAAAGPSAAAPTSITGVVDGKVNINTASAVQLELLPGIGPTLAARIVADRETNGPFSSIDDLDRVGGIGPLTIADLREMATVGR